MIYMNNCKQDQFCFKNTVNSARYLALGLEKRAENVYKNNDWEWRLPHSGKNENHYAEQSFQLADYR